MRVQIFVLRDHALSVHFEIAKGPLRIGVINLLLWLRVEQGSALALAAWLRWYLPALLGLHLPAHSTTSRSDQVFSQTAPQLTGPAAAASIAVLQSLLHPIPSQPLKHCKESEAVSSPGSLIALSAKSGLQLSHNNKPYLEPVVSPILLEALNQAGCCNVDPRLHEQLRDQYVLLQRLAFDGAEHGSFDLQEEASSHFGSHAESDIPFCMLSLIQLSPTASQRCLSICSSTSVQHFPALPSIAHSCESIPVGTWFAATRHQRQAIDAQEHVGGDAQFEHYMSHGVMHLTELCQGSLSDQIRLALQLYPQQHLPRTEQARILLLLRAKLQLHGCSHDGIAAQVRVALDSAARLASFPEQSASDALNATMDNLLRALQLDTSGCCEAWQRRHRHQLRGSSAILRQLADAPPSRLKQLLGSARSHAAFQQMLQAVQERSEQIASSSKGWQQAAAREAADACCRLHQRCSTAGYSLKGWLSAASVSAAALAGIAIYASHPQAVQVSPACLSAATGLHGIQTQTAMLIVPSS